METRNITLTLDKAKEWYNSGSSDLKKVALQAFKEEELTGPKYKDIKSFDQAIKALNLCPCDVSLDLDIEGMEIHAENHLKAIYMTNLICKALNGDWQPSLVEGTVYYPWVRFCKANEVPNNKKSGIVQYFMYGGEKYVLVSGDYSSYGHGLSDFYGGDGGCNAKTGLFGCKSREIALHMSKYFAKEIFLACYGYKLNGKVTWL